MSTRNHDRGPNGAGISLSTTKALNEAIKREALRQGRTISNYIANTIAVSLGLPPEAVIAPNKRRPRTPKTTLREVPNPVEAPPIRLKGSPEIRNPRKNDSGQACA